MPSSAEIGILTKLVELQSRFGLRATDSDCSLFFVSSEHDPDGDGYYHFELSGQPTNPEKAEKYNRVLDALDIGNDDGGCLKIDQLSELEDRIDHALSLAPRARVR